MSDRLTFVRLDDKISLMIQGLQLKSLSILSAILVVVQLF